MTVTTKKRRRRELLPEVEVLEAVEDARKDVRYLVTDIPVELIISKFRDEPKVEGDIYIPDYQRSLAWKRDKMSYFMESLILRVPIPPIFFYEVDGFLEIVDGSQRVRTLLSYIRDDEFKLDGLEKLDILNGYYCSDLPGPVRGRLLNTPVRAFVLDQGTDESTRIELFRRLNTSGKKLEDAEIRKGAYRGPLLDLILDVSSSEIIREVLPDIGGGANAESERQELVTRFFIYSDFYEEFRHDVRKFLDARLIQLNKTITDVELQRMRAEFNAAMTYVRDSDPRAFYRHEAGRRVPRVRFEAIAVGVNLALRARPNLPLSNFDWLSSEGFELLVRTDASNSGPRLRSRIEFVRDKLLGN